ncbi:phytoene desaturase family protein [Flavobacterium sediminilitoris]|uniref:Phytoene desaturase family protein n=1 Tax=Flavobacterium sediminilitoris TaxID=2024526 RepID=A0ABY4HNU8_9FLAO|nr:MULTISPECIES: phytoene desaturase family protein [Flavobacterium]UOX34007.1 phytoene desaturase family protein [Flavobacterium sediminilitoris]
MNNKIIIIGSGFASLSAACYLAKAGNEVTVFEKNETVGGRARRLSKEGFHFDIGPTWYWMPDVFEKFFNDFGKKVSDYYELEKLSPAYEVYFEENEKITISDNLEDIASTFENIEKGSAEKLRAFIKEAQENYKIAVEKMVYKPGDSPLELVNAETIVRVNQFFSTISQQVRKRFKNEKIIKILEFPVLFLGAKPSNTPSFYSFMNFADFGLGTWHPKKGMYAVIEAIETLAKELGVEIVTNANVTKILVENKKAKGICVNNENKFADIILSGADYHHSEQLLNEEDRMYSEKYWNKKIFAPSSLLFYVGFDKKLKNVSHHTLFFDTPFEAHAKEIYDTKVWPKKPLYYASFPSITDSFFAPEGKEAATFLIPIAPGLKDTQEIRNEYFDKIINRLEKTTNQSVKENIIFVESYCINDFIKDYNSYKGNAYGLANILTQTAFLRPKIKSRKVQNLFFTGQLTVPGPGVPPSLISGKIVSQKIIKEFS